MTKNKNIRKYWDSRSLEAGASPSATTQDVFLRELEILTLRKTLADLDLPPQSNVVDIGCGDGYSTLCIAESLETLSFKALDFSSNMIDVARGRLKNKSELKERLSFEVGDVCNLRASLEQESVDIAMTDRCLINLTSSEQQYSAFSEIHRALKPDGHYIGIENFKEGNDELNLIRKSMGLQEIPVRWHNLFLKQEEFVLKIKSLFRNVEIIDFSSSYYFATRVVYSKYCQMQGAEPDYHHEIHQLAVDLPPFGSVSPVKLIIMKK
ncbi:MAG: methyltransferase domain-containing protein [Planctomycetes bacterium]|nr:methyltransferase domain-containing protein [Planctomycetota bacterium]